MSFCNVIGRECPREKRCEYQVEPVDTSFFDNALNIAEHFSGNRSFDFFRSDWKSIRGVILEEYDRTHNFIDEDGNYIEKDIEYRSDYTMRRDQYIKGPEMHFITGVNFCCRDNPFYDELKSRLECAVDYDEKFVLADEKVRVKDEFVSKGVDSKKITSWLKGFVAGSSVISRMLMLKVPGAEDAISISNCTISGYFPELIQYETMEIAESDRV